MPRHWDCPDALDGEECDRAIALAADRLRPALVYGAGGYAPDPSVRLVDTSFHPRGAATQWLYERVDDLFARAAAALGVAVDPMSEDIQLMCYRPGSHFQMWHSDAGYDLRDRRILSISIELSDAADYVGGDLEIIPDLLGRSRLPRRGAARVFHSHALHRVTPVTSGARWALVNWAGDARGPHDG
jgi:PKHD-type hydroxylase